MGQKFFTTASFGKRVEYMVIAHLLRSGLDVYLPMVDDKGIDCLIRKNDGTIVEVQIKGRSTKCDVAGAGRFAAMSLKPKHGYYLIFYSEACENGAIWLMHTPDFEKLAVQNKRGKNEGKYSIVLCGARKGKEGKKEPYALERFEQFRIRGNFSEDMFKYGVLNNSNNL